MGHYREYVPSPRLAGTVECIWTMEHTGPEEPHRVLPDGCADLLFTRTAGRATLQAVGPMTGYREFPQTAGQSMVGVRFRPGMWTALLGIPGDQVTDRIVTLDDLWGARGRALLDQLADASSIRQSMARLEAGLPALHQSGRVQRAVSWMTEQHGSVSLDRLADQCGSSPRQFRRLCLVETGMTPKFLARVLRFRYALARIGSHAGSFADLALDCGYYDQAHFINDFRELSGWTPSAYPDGRFFQSPMSGLGR